MNISKRIEELRAAMSKNGIDAYIITGLDPHGSDYPPVHWRTREWISGFSGSAGLVAVLQNEAGLWTDFRYWARAAEELAGTGVQLHRVGEEAVDSMQDYLAANLDSRATVALDGRTVAAATCETWAKCFQHSNLTFRTDVDLVSGIWNDRPGLPKAPVIELDEGETGESRKCRLDALNEALKTIGGDAWIGVGLDSLAWLLNIRGNDVPYNPVVLGYLIVRCGGGVWYTDTHRLSPELTESLLEDGIQTAPYEAFHQGLASLEDSFGIVVDPSIITQDIMDRLPGGVPLKTAPDPVLAMKACKNSVELTKIRQAMEKDGVALVRFFRELETGLCRKEEFTEIEAAGMLRERRSQVPGFLDDSFASIAGFMANGALPHYEARGESAAVLQGGPYLFLIDSGGQWEEGTTDVTRTLALGKPTENQIRDYTMVLKSHIVLSRIRFPRGTRGYQLDALARVPLWQSGIDFGHGIGHGVGYRLSVHEGPQKLSPAPIDVALKAGMVVSNEPGIYREGAYGIRIENLILCREDISTDFGTFLAFETLTLAPYDINLVDEKLLDADEVRWFDDYHAEVYRRLSPLLEDEDRRWLKERTAPLASRVT